LVTLMVSTPRFLAVDQERGDGRRGETFMPFRFKALSAALSIVAAAAIVAPARAQQNPPAGQQPLPGAMQAPTPRAPVRAAGAGTAAVIATVNLRSGPGTDQEIITTIPAGSTIRVASCSGEWCEVTWNGQSGYAIARNLSIGAPRQAGAYGPRPGYVEGYGPEPYYAPPVYGEPGYYAPPAVVYGPAYYGPRVYYGPGWRRRWWW